MIDRRQFGKGMGLALGAAMLPRAMWAKTAKETSTVLLDVTSGEPILRSGMCEVPYAPFSTFKFPLALIGYDAGILRDEHNPSWEYRPELKASKRERMTTDPVIWERESILWYSREITRRLGSERFRDYVERLDYGNRDVSDWHGKDGLLHSWLGGPLKISPDEQSAFVARFLTRDLPVSDHAFRMTAKIMPTFPIEGGWTVHGKTGSGWLRNDDGSVDKSKPLGWFVGWAEKRDLLRSFARLEIGNMAVQEAWGPAARKSLLAELPAMLRI